MTDIVEAILDAFIDIMKELAKLPTWRLTLGLFILGKDVSERLIRIKDLK